MSTWLGVPFKGDKVCISGVQKPPCWHFVRDCLGEIFQTVHDDFLHSASHCQTSFYDFDILWRWQQCWIDRYKSCNVSVNFDPIEFKGCTVVPYKYYGRGRAQNPVVAYLKEILTHVWTWKKPFMLVFSQMHLSELFTLHDDSLNFALHIHASANDLDPFLRPLQSLRK